MSIVLDRSKAPQLIKAKQLELPTPEKTKLDNGMPLVMVGGLPQEALKIEWVFYAGRWFEDSRLQSRFTARMIREGSAKYPSKEFAEQLDQYGASVKTTGGADVSTITLFTLNKYLHKVLPIMADVIKHPAFEQRDLHDVVTNSKQNLLVNMEKNEYLADHKFNEALYGKDHPYGYFHTAVDYELVTPKALADHHKTYYHPDNGMIIVSGNITADVAQQLNEHFGGTDWTGKSNYRSNEIDLEQDPGNIREKYDDSMQSSIRIGKILFNKTHPDHQALSVLNTIFGGYFGSRLMSNIREDKGYTYGIYSQLASMRHGGNLMITTDVGTSVCDAAVKEIYLEMQRLIDEPIPERELELVKNYLSGRIQSSVDGPFRLAAMLKGLLIYDLNIDYIYTFIDLINNIEPITLQELAAKYLVPDDMQETVIG